MYHEEVLVHSILLQAVEDLQNLAAKRKRSSDNVKEGIYSVDEIERFFNSDWCEVLLGLIDCHVSGKEIFNKLQRKYEVCNCDIS